MNGKACKAAAFRRSASTFWCLNFGWRFAAENCYGSVDDTRVAVRAVTQGVVVCVLIDAVFIVLYLVT